MKKRYFIDNKEELYKDFPKTERLGWCSECGQISFVDQSGGPFQSVSDSCGDPAQAKKCKHYGVKAMREKEQRRKEYELEQRKREKDPKYQKLKAETAEFMKLLDLERKKNSKG